MTDKEMNMAILNELYTIAHGVWVQMKKNTNGSFTAREVHKHISKELKWGDVDEYQVHDVSVGTFSCTLSNKILFDIVARFETLAGVGSKRHLFTAEEKGEVEGSVTFNVSKAMGSLCDFADSKSIHPAYLYILIDTVRNCLIATDGHKIMVQPVNITDRQGDTTEMRINAEDFRKMCKKMKGKEVYQMTARKEHVYLDHITKVEFEGILSSVSTDCKSPKWDRVFSKRSSDLSLEIYDWAAVYNFAKSVKSDMMSMTGKRDENFIYIEADGSIRKVSLLHAIPYDFKVYIGKASIMATKGIDAISLYLGRYATEGIQAVSGDGVVYIFMPGLADDSFVGNRLGDHIDTPHPEMDVDILQLYTPAEKLDVPTSVSEVKSEKTPAPETEKTTDKAPAKKSQARKPADGSRKFSFAAVGVKPGDKLTFVDGTEVMAADDNKVMYRGDVYTLSGFCKQFMPEEKRNKANSYRGCAFFYIDGVKLEKLFKETLKDKECEVEQVATVEIEAKDVLDVTEVKTEPDVMERPQVAEHRPHVSADVTNTFRLVSVACAARSVADWLIVHSGRVTPRERKRIGCLTTRRAGQRGLVRKAGSVGMMTVDSVPASDAQVVHTMALPPPLAA